MKHIRAVDASEFVDDADGGEEEKDGQCSAEILMNECDARHARFMSPG